MACSYVGGEERGERRKEERGRYDMYSITAETERLAYRTCMFDNNKFTPHTTEQISEGAQKE